MLHVTGKVGFWNLYRIWLISGEWGEMASGQIQDWREKKILVAFSDASDSTRWEFPLRNGEQ